MVELPVGAALTEREAKAEIGKVGKAVGAILAALEATESMPLDELRRAVMREGHSEYSFKTALKRLESEGRIQLAPDKSKPGNCKTVRMQKHIAAVGELAA